jgi:hypothetical protein
MKKIATLELYSPGIVVFDPVVLNDFLKKNNVTETDIFNKFLDDENLGRAVVEQGVLFPLYQIPENEYSVFVLDGSVSVGIDVEAKFIYSEIPLKVSSATIVVADFNALFDWDSDFFISYRDNYDQRLLCNDYLDVPSGLYSLTVKGFVGLRAPLTSLGYGIEFSAVSDLPKIGSDSSVGDRDFAL